MIRSSSLYQRSVYVSSPLASEDSVPRRLLSLTRSTILNPPDMKILDKLKKKRDLCVTLLYRRPTWIIRGSRDDIEDRNKSSVCLVMIQKIVVNLPWVTLWHRSSTWIVRGCTWWYRRSTWINRGSRDDTEDRCESSVGHVMIQKFDVNRPWVHVMIQKIDVNRPWVMWWYRRSTWINRGSRDDTEDRCESSVGHVMIQKIDVNQPWSRDDTEDRCESSVGHVMIQKIDVNQPWITDDDAHARIA